MKTAIAAVAILAALSGCQPGTKTLAPTHTTEIQAQHPGAHLATVEVDGHEVLAWVEYSKFSPNHAKILYYCDYPVGVYGPLPEGHCYEDGSGCSGLPGSGDINNWVAHTKIGDPDIGDIMKGDPTADDAQQGDGDGTVVR